MKIRTSARAGGVRFVLLALVVLLVAMTTSATAGALITGERIKDGSVTGKDLRNGSVTGVDVRDSSLTPDDFTGSVQGPQGPEGPPGPAGPRGPAGFSGVEYRVLPVEIPSGQARRWGVLCPVGMKVGGGGVTSEVPFGVRLTESAPLNDGVGWVVGARSIVSTRVVAHAWAVCVTTP